MAVLNPPIKCVIIVALSETVIEAHRERGQMPVYELEKSQHTFEHML